MTSGDQDSGIAGQLDESRSSTTSSFVFFRRCSLTSPFHLHQNCKTFSFLFPCMCQDCRTSWSPFSNVSVPQCPLSQCHRRSHTHFLIPLSSKQHNLSPLSSPLSSTGLAEYQSSPIQSPAEEQRFKENQGSIGHRDKTKRV